MAEMSPLRRRMIEDMTVRNLSRATQRSYIHAVAKFSRALMEATGWQPHSVRGFLSAVVGKKLGLTLVSETGTDGVRRYRIERDAARAS